MTDEELIEDARSKVSPIAAREFPDSVLLASDIDRMSEYPNSFGKVSLACYQGRVQAFLPLFPPKDGHGQSGVATDAGPCPCGGDRAKCRFMKVGLPCFDLAEAVRQAADMVAKADSLPHVTRHVKCPKGCQEDHRHGAYNAIGVMSTTLVDPLIPYARRCLRYAAETPGSPATS